MDCPFPKTEPHETSWTDLIERVRAMEVSQSAADDSDRQEESDYAETDSDQSYDTLSDGFKDILGDENISLEGSEDEFEENNNGEVEAPSVEIDSVKVDQTKKYAESLSRSDNMTDYPAIKLTFNDQVNIVQLKIIQSKMKELGRICGSAEIVSECQLNVHFHEVEETWKALQWIYNNENQEQGLRDFGNGLTLKTADYVPVSKWTPDYDDLFTIKVSFGTIKKYAAKDFFVTFSRFGQVRKIWIDSSWQYLYVRYKRQIDAEKAILSIDRSYFFQSWCRAIKSNALTQPLNHEIEIGMISQDNVFRKDLFIKLAGFALQRDSWKKLLALVSEYGDVDALYGDSEGVIVSFSQPANAMKCYTQIQNQKFLGKKLVAEKQFHVDQIL